MSELTERRQNERRSGYVSISEQDIENIAERAATKALEKVYSEIGKSVVQKVLYLVGAVCIAVAAWVSSGKPPIPPLTP